MEETKINLDDSVESYNSIEPTTNNDDINKYFRGLHQIKSNLPFKVGLYTMVYGKCYITFEKHDEKNFTSFNFDSQSSVCEIGSDVIIYPNVRIYGGVTIGHGSRLLEGSVITNNIKPYSIVDSLGNIKSRFSDDIIESLLKLEWWSLPYDTILKHKDLLCSDSSQLIIEQFVSRKENKS